MGANSHLMEPAAFVAMRAVVNDRPRFDLSGRDILIYELNEA
ncbi:MAG: hypothetical protein ACOYI9_12085 [Candidatus Hydrogenedentales bacterium]|jgi:hypothetical protein